MGHYASVRGWLKLSEEMVPLVREAIEDTANIATLSETPLDTAEFYNRGWVFPVDHINWVSYIFYGADIRLYHLAYLREQLKAIAEKVKLRDDTFIELLKDSTPNEDDLLDYPDGLFYVDDDDREVSLCWEITRGKFLEYPRHNADTEINS
jgi:hypothetical protein